MSRLLSLYHHLPPFARHIAASARGYVLKRQRYTEQMEPMIEALLERDRWSAQQWRTYQENELEKILDHAIKHVPYYRDWWQEQRRAGNQQTHLDLNNWPVINKQNIRQNPAAFISEAGDSKRFINDRTGGTTGTPLSIMLTPEANQWNYAMHEARIRRWYGLDTSEPWATMGGQVIIPPDAKHPPYWVWNWPMNHVYLSTNHLSAETTPHYIKALKRQKTTFIVAYTTSIAYLARQAYAQGLEPPTTLQAVITNAEGLFPWQRDIIQKGLGCPSIETYGMVELAACATEREGQLYVWPDIGVVEILADEADTSVPDEQSGRIVGTGLLNYGTMLIRYDVGDRGAIKRVAEGTPTFAYDHFKHIEGRKTDLLINSEGRQVWYFNPLFVDVPIHEAQVVQEDPFEVKILYVPAPDFNDDHIQTITERFQMRMAQTQLKLVPVDRVPREPNGKFRPVVNRLSDEQRQMIEEKRHHKV